MATPRPPVRVGAAARRARAAPMSADTAAPLLRLTRDRPASPRRRRHTSAWLPGEVEPIVADGGPSTSSVTTGAAASPWRGRHSAPTRALVGVRRLGPLPPGLRLARLRPDLADAPARARTSSNRPSLGSAGGPRLPCSRASASRATTGEKLCPSMKTPRWASPCSRSTARRPSRRWSEWGKELDRCLEACRGSRDDRSRRPVRCGSRPTPKETVEQLGAQIVTMEGQGHWWMLGDPAQGAKALTDFWASL